MIIQKPINIFQAVMPVKDQVTPFHCSEPCDAKINDSFEVPRTMIVSR